MDEKLMKEAVALLERQLWRAPGGARHEEIAAELVEIKAGPWPKTRQGQMRTARRIEQLGQEIAKARVVKQWIPPVIE